MTPSSPLLVGPLAVAHPRPPYRRGAGRLVTTYLDGRREPLRPPVAVPRRSALAAIIALSGLTARLFYLQIVDGGQFATLADAQPDGPPGRSRRRAA